MFIATYHNSQKVKTQVPPTDKYIKRLLWQIRGAWTSKGRVYSYWESGKSLVRAWTKAISVGAQWYLEQWGG